MMYERSLWPPAGELVSRPIVEFVGIVQRFGHPAMWKWALGYVIDLLSLIERKASWQPS